MSSIDRSFLCIESNAVADAALARLDADPNAHWIVVRRPADGRIYWFSFSAAQARAMLKSCEPGVTIEKAFDLHEGGACATRGEDDLSSAQPGDIVLDPHGNPTGVVSGLDSKQLEHIRRAVDVAPGAGARHYAPMRVPTPSGGWRTLGGGVTAGASPPSPKRRRTPEARAKAKRPGMRRKKRRPEAPKRGALPSTPHRARPAASPGGSVEFLAWPSIKAPAKVKDGESFPLEVGLAEERTPGVAGDRVRIPTEARRFVVQLTIHAAGFRSAKGWQHDLPVDRDALGAAHLMLRLTAAAGAWPKGQTRSPRLISVIYEYRGEVCGVAQRRIVIERPGAVRAAPGRLPAQQATIRLPMWARDGAPRADLTVVLLRSDRRRAHNDFSWSFHSPHMKLPAPTRPQRFDDATSFAREILKNATQEDRDDENRRKLGRRSPLLKKHLLGAGRRVTDRVPSALWIAIAAVAKHPAVKGRVPDVLFLTEEWCIPWELAVMPTPLDARIVPCLGAQVNLGRWVVGGPAESPQPGTQIDVRKMVVLYGEYPQRADRLPDAIRERDTLVRDERAMPVPLEDNLVERVLDGAKPAGGSQLLHFACHGVGDAARPGDTHLVLESGTPLTDDMLRDARVGPAQHPFLFLNACEAGIAGSELDMVSGFVGSAIQAGFHGCVGAVWAVESATARRIALDFYRRTLRKGESVASALRRIRARWVPKLGRAPDNTYLAYVFYGHPALKLKKLT